MSGINWNTAGIIVTMLGSVGGGVVYLTDHFDDQHALAMLKIDETRSFLKDDIDSLEQDIENLERDIQGLALGQKDQAIELKDQIEESLARAAESVQPKLEGLIVSDRVQDEKNKDLSKDLERVAEGLEENEDKIESVDNATKALNSSMKQMEETVDTVILPAIAPKE